MKAEAVRMNLAGKGKQGSAERQAGSGKEVGRHLGRRQQARRNRQVKAARRGRQAGRQRHETT
jgi:hypothetical protein